MSFDNEMVTPLSGSNMEAVEASASISDLEGQLLFYTNGIQIYNRNNSVMDYGDNIKGSKNATQGALIIPKPGSSSIYYLFTIADSFNNANNLYVTEVDMSLNNGLGGIGAFKNHLVRAGVTERLAATLKNGSSSVWMMCQDANETQFHAYLIDENGVAMNAVSSSVGQSVSSSWGVYVGQMKFSPNGKYLGWACKGDRFVEILEFNATTGYLNSVSRKIQYSSSDYPYGLEFSPDGQRLYVSIINKGIYQYDMGMYMSESLFLTSSIKITTVPCLGLQTGPNGKIYAAANFHTRLHSIEAPNNGGNGCSFLTNAVVLSDVSREGLPAFISNYFIENPIQYGVSCSGESTMLHFRQDQADSIVWDLESGKTGTGYSTSNTFTSPGAHTVKARIYWGDKVDSFSREIEVKPKPVFDFGADKTICYGEKYLLNPAISQASYRWQDGASTPVYEAKESGLYWVEVSRFGCKSQDSITITVDHPKVVVFSNQTGNCENDNKVALRFTQGDAVKDLTWDLGDQTTSHANNPEHRYTSAGLYQVKLETVNKNGCKATDKLEIEINPVAFAGIGVNEAEQCLNGNLFEFTYPGVSSFPFLSDYTFTLTDGNSSKSNFTHSFTQAGEPVVKLYTVTDKGCRDTTELFLKVFPNPQPVMVVDSAMACETGNLIKARSLSSSPNGDLVSQTIESNGQLFTGAQADISYNKQGKYLITLEVVDEYGCELSLTEEVQIHENPTASFNLVMNGNCAGNDPIVTQNQSTGPKDEKLTYSWDFGNGSGSDQFEPTFSYETASAFMVSLKVETEKGCSAEAKQKVISYESPVADFGIENLEPCLNENRVNLINASGITGNDLLFFEWRVDGQLIRSRDIHGHHFSDTGEKQIQLKVISEKGCISTKSESIRILPSPQVQFAVNDPSQCLAGNSFEAVANLENNPNPISDLIWDTDNGEVHSGLRTRFNYQEAGVYLLQLTATNEAGCSSMASGTLRVYPQPQAEFETGTVCQNQNIQLVDKSSISEGKITGWFWDFGDETGSSQKNPYHIFSEPGIIPVYLEVTSDKGCKDYHFSKITVHESLPAEFSFRKYKYDTDKGETVYEFSSMPVPSGYVVSWYLNGIPQGTGRSIQLGFGDTGTYDVTMTVSNGSGCPSSALKQVFVAPPFELYLPNAFSPDGDGLNDTFLPVGNNYILEYDMIVVNRWGSVIFQSHDIANGWDGTFGGNAAEPGTYVYYIQVKDVEGEFHSYKGSVILLQ